MTLSVNILDLINRQYSHELANYLFYSNLQSKYDFLGLTGIAKFLQQQAADEQGHAKIVLDYISDRNQFVTLKPVDLSGFDAMGQLMIDFQAIKEREVLTSAMLNEILAQAKTEGDSFSETWLLNGLVKEQIEEENTIQTILDRIAARGQDQAAAHDLDIWIGSL